MHRRRGSSSHAAATRRGVTRSRRGPIVVPPPHHAASLRGEAAAVATLLPHRLCLFVRVWILEEGRRPREDLHSGGTGTGEAKVAAGDILCYGAHLRGRSEGGIAGGVEVRRNPWRRLIPIGLGGTGTEAVAVYEGCRFSAFASARQDVPFTLHPTLKANPTARRTSGSFSTRGRRQVACATARGLGDLLFRVDLRGCAAPPHKRR
jgi:hypothetical protein